MELIRVFGELGRHDAGIAGGKGASLGEMTQAGIPVPPGFVILSNAFERFLEETDLNVEIDSILHGVDTKAMHTIEHASETIQKLILEATMPEDIKVLIQTSFQELGTTFVAVRSSATAEDSASAAWAGQLDSFLNTTEATLLENVQRCWASLFTPRAIFYRFEQGLHDSKISVAVVVQEMVESEVSGIVFSVHPVTEDRNQLIIEAGFGLGEAIVSGSVTPDSYVVEKEPRKILDINVSTQNRALYRVGEAGGNEWRNIPEPKASSQVLTEAQILELSELIIHIENHYGFPCDIEWAYEACPNAEGGQAGKFYIVQSRPITTLTDVPEKGKIDILRNIVWHSDWSGPFSLFSLTATAGTVYMGGLQKYFGKHLTHFFVPYREGIAFARLPEHEYQEFGKYLLEKTKDKAFVSNWVRDFKNAADKVTQNIPDSPQKFLEEFQNLLPFYEEYGAYNVATKIVFDVCYLDLTESVKKELEEARKYSETFYKDDAVRFGSAIQFIADEIGYSTEEVEMITYEEFEQYRKTCILPTRELLAERRKSSGAYFTEQGVEILSPHDMSEIESYWLSQEQEEGIRGQVAYKGKVQGMCRIILRYNDATFNEGEVLVTGMTDPHFLPLMKKAIAIVTDGGGMLSHAAIVSRELGIPCVVGTKIATQVLKDGDLVEVDADNGVVRVIEKAQEKKEIVLSKYMSREHSVFYAHVWNESNRDYFDEYIPDTNIKNMLFVRNQRGVLDVYYDLDELKTIFDRIVRGIIDNPSILDTVIGDFYTHWKELLPYLNGEKHISSSEDLKSFYTHYMRWWGPMAYIFVIPDREGMPEDLRMKALKVREETQEYSDEGDRVYLEYITRTLPNLESIAHLMTPEEAYRGETLSPEEIAEIEHRNSGCGLLTILGNTHFSPTAVTEEVLKEFGIQLASLEVGDTEEIKGASASTGKVQGRVKMVLVKADLVHVAEGDIMVTYATSPDYVPAMKKCSGIVTDEGGVACHAAIVSRELGIPCVVGTKIATQVLKDGDLVEVDADNGVVHVLERVQETSLTDAYIACLGTQELFPPLHNSTLFVQTSGWNTEMYFGKHYADKETFPLLITAKEGEGIMYIPATKAKNLSEEVFKSFWGNSLLLEERLEEYKRQTEIVDRVYGDVVDSDILSTKTFEELIPYIQEIRTAVWEMNTLAFFSIYFDKEICKRILGEKNSEISPERLDAMWERGITPVSDSFEKRRENLVLSLLDADVAWRDIALKCQYFGANYNNVVDVVLIENELREKYGHLSDNEKRKKAIEERDSLKEKMIHDHEEWCATLSLEEQRLVRYLQTIINLRDSRKDYISKFLLVVFRISQKLFDEADVDQKLIYFYMLDEIVKGKDYLLENRELLEKRLLGCSVFVDYDGTVKIEYGDFEHTKNKFGDFFLGQQKHLLSSESIKGQSGSTRKVQGKVSVIMSLEKDSHKFIDGSVLVTGMTRPEFVPLMKRALAVVTDEGGITCHAAIVSRELGIPCVVGTKIATQVLKDGDLVEVDADNGVVRVLERAK